MESLSPLEATAIAYTGRFAVGLLLGHVARARKPEAIHATMTHIMSGWNSVYYGVDFAASATFAPPDERTSLCLHSAATYLVVPAGINLPLWIKAYKSSRQDNSRGQT